MGGAADDAANMGGAAPEYALKDTTSAHVDAGSVLNSAGDITVEANDTFKVDMFTGAIAVSGITSVGVGISVAVLNGNVLAFVQSGASLEADGDIYVTAKAGSESTGLRRGDDGQKERAAGSGGERAGG